LSSPALFLQERTTLRDANTTFFNKERLNPSREPSVEECMDYQAHMLLHCLNDNVMPTPRGSLLKALIIGKNFDVCSENGKMQYQINVSNFSYCVWFTHYRRTMAYRFAVLRSQRTKPNHRF